jgi:hypothetical protein
MAKNLEECNKKFIHLLKRLCHHLGQLLRAFSPRAAAAFPHLT